MESMEFYLSIFLKEISRWHCCNRLLFFFFELRLYFTRFDCGSDGSWMFMGYFFL